MINRMMNVLVTEGALRELDALPAPIRIRVQNIFTRLRNWPAVSGAKPLRGELAGHFRVRTGDYRLIFQPDSRAGEVVVWKIGNRGDIYD